MRIDADVKRPVDSLFLAVFADRLGNRQYVPFVETAFERTAAVTGGPEGNALRRHRRVGLQGDVGGAQLRHIDQRCSGRRCASERAGRGAHAIAGSAKVLESRRRRALLLVQAGLSLNAVARRLGCAPSSVMLWMQAHERQGEAGLKVRAAPGR